ncbi:hypothetical protein CKF54_06955 [Psittacicella hinzii]|uniref:Uncharacterized protein n=1 Tax=Psittacicella hinzii TaxID=2028575 RepID=A0A3A1XZ31_9GAMM|nr:AzlD domain-containing protein [Psittacicella hinzii]RIY31282.1 hypothetical protein CKF54_06955 [Psittacicella hinzii]
MMPEFSNLDYLLMMLVLAAGTALSRCLPLLVPKKVLQAQWLVALNRSLSLCIMTILTFASLSIPDVNAEQVDWGLIGSQVVALVLVLAIYIRFKSTFLAVILGIACVSVPWLAVLTIFCFMPNRAKFAGLNPLRTLRLRKNSPEDLEAKYEDQTSSLDTLAFAESAEDSQKIARTVAAMDKLNSLKEQNKQQEDDKESAS